MALGGGSTIGLGKAIAVRTGADQVAVPTTYAGSEMTDILGETAAGRKTTRRDPAILPETVIYDVALTLGLPPGLTATSGLNALAHAVEALYARDRNPVLSLMAVEAIAALGRGAAGAGGGSGGPGGAAAGALRGVALRRGARRHHDGAAPQALPRARRQLRAAAFRDACGDIAARGGLQRRCRGRAAGAGRRGAGRRASRARRSSGWRGGSARR